MSGAVTVTSRSIVVASLLALTASLGIADSASAAADHTPPSVSAPVVRLSSGFGITFGAVATTSITVTGHDAGGLSSSAAQFAISRNGAAYVTLVPTSYTAHGTYDSDGVARTMSIVTPRTFALSGTYRVRARMRDRTGNWSPWIAGPVLSPRRIDEASPSIVYSSGWTHVADPAPGMSYEIASAPGETAALTFTARSVDWLARPGLDHGSAEIRIDGVLVATVDLYRDLDGSRRPMYSKTWSTLAKHVLTVTVVGSAGHPEVDLSGFLILA